MGRGTEAFPDLGEHCKHEDCRKLDFLPFTCDGCHKVFCLEHRTSRAHGCPKSDHNGRMVVVCGACSMSMEKEVGEEEEIILERHGRSGECDPAKKQKRSRCPVTRCKQTLTLSNTSVCGGCRLKVCLKHRFPSDHACRLSPPTTRRRGTDCGSAKRNISASPPPAIEAC